MVSVAGFVFLFCLCVHAKTEKLLTTAWCDLVWICIRVNARGGLLTLRLFYYVFLYSIFKFFRKEKLLSLQTTVRFWCSFIWKWMLVGSVSWVRVGAFDLVSLMAADRLVLAWGTVFNSGFAHIMLAQMSHYLLVWDECCICLKQTSCMLLCASGCWSFLCYTLWMERQRYDMFLYCIIFLLCSQ